MSRALQKLSWVLSLWLGAAAAVSAAAIGEPERTARIGYGLSVGNISVEDPDGSVESTNGVFPFNIIYTDRLTGSFRYWAEGFYQSLSGSNRFEASTGNIGQEMDRYGVRLSLQRRLEFIPVLDVWGGAGFFASRDNFTNRHTAETDPDGRTFILDQYPDEKRNVLGIQFDLTAEWQVGLDWDLAGRLLYGVPFGNGAEELSGLIGILYTY